MPVRGPDSSANELVWHKHDPLACTPRGQAGGKLTVESRVPPCLSQSCTKQSIITSVTSVTKYRTKRHYDILRGPHELN